ncbi:MAG: hypothetical protein RLZZ524_1911 [Pseudomonadota bacterium]|jgi:hypothetical protein
MTVAIRDAIVARVDPLFRAAYPDLMLVHDNQPFDRSVLPERWVEFTIEFDEAEQATIAVTSPRTRQRGCVHVDIYSRAGLGSRAGLQIIEWFVMLLAYERVGAAQFKVPQQSPANTAEGWYRQSLALPFFADIA